ncbi:S-layer homology domain-containing protein [Sporosarcina sp. Sa2YVA2]|uniref:S-layer homology domain-containing protein n=1 Tax=Sporosarcina quadrami TaxID=2762234 RepID=A0ABR8U9Q2_9BACL|nr:S-layer homology domain-containing protein [Sporosarcina quadrami]MBD7984747.1 S-layer homology domain-containing protein [Sporosarcina quadrami]
MKSTSKFLSMVVMLVVLLISSSASPVNAARQFKDVKPGHWAFESVNWAYDQGLTKGYPDGTFAPDKPITEAQLVTMLVRLDCSSPDSFPSEPGQHKASGNYWYLSGKNIPLDGQNRTFAKDWPVKRSTAAQIIAAYNGYDLDKKQAVQYLYTEDLATGRAGKNTWKDFSPDDSLTRAEAVDLLRKVSMNGSCDIVGLKKRASGKDNGTFPLPSSFDDDGTVHFPTNNKPSKPPVVINPGASNEVDIDKSELIANGNDSTYVTVSFKDCNGNTIPYDRSLAVRVTSSAGATLAGDTEKYDYDWSNNHSRPYKTSIMTGTDGPDATVKVTAPLSKTYLKDTLTFELIQGNGSSYINCANQIVTVNLDYVPKAEVRLEIVPERYTQNGTLIEREKVVTTIVLPGGEVVRNFRGHVNLRSTSGIQLTTYSPSFVSGAATAYVIPNESPEPIRGEIIAEVVPYNSFYPVELTGVINETHSVDITHDGFLSIDAICSNEIPEMAFIIDASGSMMHNDPKSFRITKTQGLINNLQAERNIAIKFNSSSQHLITDQWFVVPPHLTRIGQSGGTNIGAGMNSAFDRMSSSGSKVAILLTDGNSSESSIQSALDKAVKGGIVVYTIGLGKERNLNSPLLKKIAKDTGGTYYHITDSIDLGLVYQSIIKEITCGVPALTCSSASMLFENPSVTFGTPRVVMETDLREGCGQIAKVVVRFNSSKGNIDYELVHRGHNNYRFIIDKDEIANYHLYTSAQFIAYDRSNNQVGAIKTVPIK